jgi:hypothetical protein
MSAVQTLADPDRKSTLAGANPLQHRRFTPALNSSPSNAGRSLVLVEVWLAFGEGAVSQTYAISRSART